MDHWAHALYMLKSRRLWVEESSTYFTSVKNKSVFWCLLVHMQQQQVQRTGWWKNFTVISLSLKHYPHLPPRSLWRQDVSWKRICVEVTTPAERRERRALFHERYLVSKCSSGYIMQIGFAGKGELFLCFSSKVQRRCSCKKHHVLFQNGWSRICHRTSRQ